MNDSDRERAFLGSGLAFPLSLDGQGRFTMNSLEDHSRQSVLLILKTAKGERVMRPTFGAGLHNLVFEPINSTTKALVKHEVEEALIKFEPRIDVLKVDVKDAQEQQGEPAMSEGKLFINLQYRIRKTDTIFNLVYPFYLERGEL